MRYIRVPHFSFTAGPGVCRASDSPGGVRYLRLRVTEQRSVYMKKFSRLSAGLGEGVFARLAEKKREVEARGVEIIDLYVGTPDFPCEKHIIDAGIEAMKDPENIKYTLLDSPELIDAVIAYYGERYGVALTPGMIASCNGTQDGMGHIGMILADPGDIALLPDPGYIAFETSALFAHAKPYYYRLTAENDFLPDFSSVPEEVMKKAAYLVLSYPSNPVGAAAPKRVYEEAIALSEKYGFAVIADNAYSDICYDGEGGSFLACEGAADAGAEFFSLSKSFDTTGARISFLIGNEALVGAFRRLRSQYDFGMFAPVQAMAVAALAGDRTGVKERREQYRVRRDVLCSGLRSLGWDVRDPDGTMFVWARIPGGFGTSERFVSELLEHTGVMCTPGSAFGPSGEGYVRFALVKPADVLEAAVGRIREYFVRTGLASKR